MTKINCSCQQNISSTRWLIRHQFWLFLSAVPDKQNGKTTFLESSELLCFPSLPPWPLCHLQMLSSLLSSPLLTHVWSHYYLSKLHTYMQVNPLLPVHTFPPPTHSLGRFTLLWDFWQDLRYQTPLRWRKGKKVHAWCKNDIQLPLRKYYLTQKCQQHDSTVVIKQKNKTESEMETERGETCGSNLVV